MVEVNRYIIVLHWYLFYLILFLWTTRQICQVSIFYQGLNFGTGLWVLCILLLIPEGFTQTTNAGKQIKSLIWIFCQSLISQTVQCIACCHKMLKIYTIFYCVVMRPLVILTHTNNMTQNNTVCLTWGSNAECNMGCGSHLKCQIRMTTSLSKWIVSHHNF